jgi:hypothetical protein
MVCAAFRDESHTMPISYFKKLLTDLVDKFIATISCALEWLQPRSITKVMDIFPVAWKQSSVFFKKSVFINIYAIIITIIIIIYIFIVIALSININYFTNGQRCIMYPSFLRVAQYLIGIINKRKSYVCIIFAQMNGLTIRMVIFCQIKIRTLDLPLGSIHGDTQYLVEIL